MYTKAKRDLSFLRRLVSLIKLRDDVCFAFSRAVERLLEDNEIDVNTTIGTGSSFLHLVRDRIIIYVSMRRFSF